MPSKLRCQQYTHQDILPKRTSLNEHLLQLVVDKDCGFPFDEAYLVYLVFVKFKVNLLLHNHSLKAGK